MLNRFDIRKGDKVLDIGCGGLPFLFATHLADLTSTDNSKRFGAIPVTHLPFCECSVEALPFRDQAFDFIHCTHVLEHLRDPAAACREFMRVGKRGYVECPRSWTEYAFHAPDHRWLVDHEGNSLIFREKLDEEKKDFLGIQYSIFSWLQDPKFRRYWNSPAVRVVRNVEFYWERKFDFVVVRKDQRKNAGAYGWFHSGALHGNKGGSATLREELRSELLRILDSRI